MSPQLRVGGGVLGVVLVEQLERASDIGGVDPQPDAGRPLPETRGLPLLGQARACELVDSLAQTDVALPAQALRRSGDLGIES